MRIQILGTGCAKCARLAEQAKKAADELGLDYSMEKVSSIEVILAQGVLVTPALLVDGKLKVSGSVPALEEMKKILESER
ncbi:MAG: thioredoxin family protein [Planctomycetia bacterium]|nr:thioredoxin family protein [Planctomycetia bacterium]